MHLSSRANAQKKNQKLIIFLQKVRILTKAKIFCIGANPKKSNSLEKMKK